MAGKPAETAPTIEDTGLSDGVSCFVLRRVGGGFLCGRSETEAAPDRSGTAGPAYLAGPASARCGGSYRTLVDAGIR